jgi:hypothetical protein
LLFLVVFHLGGVASGRDLLARYETGDLAFEEIEIGDKQVYFHVRKIGEATVEKDFIVYQFDRRNGELLARKEHWRDDLPDEIPPLGITRGEAEHMVEGQVQFTDLYIISPESDVFPIEPVPDNPCWVVRSIDGDRMVVTVIDAVEGKVLGNGVPPPYTAFSLTGPWYFNPCSGGWSAWYQNAQYWFDTMGYQTEAVFWPTENKIRSHVQSHQTAMFYELAHGSSDIFSSGCIGGEDEENTTAYEIYTWMFGYAKMPFTFLGSCGGMCETGAGSFSFQFRKGSNQNAIAVGYCGMAEAYCSSCWGVSVDWQDALFGYMNQGWTVKAAFDQANADYPVCPAGDCMRFSGDESFAVVPVVKRDPQAPQVTVVQPDGGELLEYGTDYEIQWTATDNVIVASITIVLSMDGGMAFPDTIASGEANDGSYVWPVPDDDSKMARIKVIAIDGAQNEGSDMSDDDFTLWGTTSSIEMPGLAAIPDEVVLRVVGGNPAASGSDLIFGLPDAGQVSLDLYDVSGRLVQALVSGYRDQGYHRLEWDGTWGSGTRLGPGIYFVRLESEGGKRTAKLIVAQ